jgi:uncharacterized protein YndB with AHSA1/START domain
MMELKLAKFEIEYQVNTSPGVLFYFLHAPTGLSEWFCDDVFLKDKNYTFSWEGEKREAELINFKINKLVQFRWLDMPDDSYFQFILQVDDITKDLALIITDFEPQKDHESSKLLWDAQISQLLKCVGA